MVVVDEAWAILANLGVARWLQSSWKLSRARGVSNVAVLHRLSDLDTTGAVGSEQVGLAQGLLSDSETRVVYAQPPGEVDRAAPLLGLSSTEAELVPAAPTRCGAVEGRRPVLLGPASAVAARAVHRRHRRPHGRPGVNGLVEVGVAATVLVGWRLSSAAGAPSEHRLGTATGPSGSRRSRSGARPIAGATPCGLVAARAPEASGR